MQPRTPHVDQDNWVSPPSNLAAQSCTAHIDQYTWDPPPPNFAVQPPTPHIDQHNWVPSPPNFAPHTSLIEADYSGNNVVVTTATSDQGNLRKSTRVTQVPQNLRDYEVYKDGQITEGGDLVHLALYAGAEPIDVEEALQEPQWIQAMKEELSSMNKIISWPEKLNERRNEFLKSL